MIVAEVLDQRDESRWEWSAWSVDPGGSTNRSTRRTHLWGVFDEDRECLGVFRPGIEAETVERVR